MTVLRYTVITMGIGMYVWALLRETPVDLKTLSPETLSAIIESQDICDIADLGDSIFVKNDTFSFEIVQSKISTFFDRQRLFNFLREQFYFAHLLSETIMERRFAWTLILAAVVTIAIEFFVVRGMNSLLRTQNSVENLENAQMFSTFQCASNFFPEKLAVLIFCIARTEPPVDNKIYIDFGEYVRETMTIRPRATDVTIFASWFMLLSIVHINTHTIWFRFKKTIPLLSLSQIVKLRRNADFIAFFFTICSLAGLATIVFVASVLTWTFLHPIYSLVLVLESLRTCLRAVDLVNRTSICMRTPRMHELEARKMLLNDEQIVDFIMRDGVVKRKNHEAASHFVSMTLNILYAIMGMLYNLKVLSIGFLVNASENYRFFNGERETDLDDLL